MMILTNGDDDDDYEPQFRQRYINDPSVENKHGYWEDYNRINKTWFRLCDKCMTKVCRSCTYLCTFHYNQLKKRKSKCLKENLSSNRIPMEEMNESLGIVISISSSLTKKQISQVKKFITQFHSDSQSIQFTCESQLDYIDDTTTHVITNDYGLFTTNITKQIIQACVRHIFISSINWIISSLEQSCILDHFPYEILRDRKSSINTRGIKQCRFDQLPVFPSSCILSIECHTGIKSLRITRDELIEIIELSGASLLNDYIEYETLIILCNTKKEVTDKKKFFNEKNSNVYYCKPDFLFESIVRHEVQPIEKYLW